MQTIGSYIQTKKGEMTRTGRSKSKIKFLWKRHVAELRLQWCQSSIQVLSYKSCLVSMREAHVVSSTTCRKRELTHTECRRKTSHCTVLQRSADEIRLAHWLLLYKFKELFFFKNWSTWKFEVNSLKENMKIWTFLTFETFYTNSVTTN